MLQDQKAGTFIETLDVTAPALSRWPNRILARSGREVVREKLRNFEDRYGITFAEVKPACSSQTCSNLACGHENHAAAAAMKSMPT